MMLPINTKASCSDKINFWVTTFDGHPTITLSHPSLWLNKSNKDKAWLRNFNILFFELIL